MEGKLFSDYIDFWEKFIGYCRTLSENHPLVKQALPWAIQIYYSEASTVQKRLDRNVYLANLLMGFENHQFRHVFATLPPRELDPALLAFQKELDKIHYDGKSGLYNNAAELKALADAGIAYPDVWTEFAMKAPENVYTDALALMKMDELKLMTQALYIQAALREEFLSKEAIKVRKDIDHNAKMMYLWKDVLNKVQHCKKSQ